MNRIVDWLIGVDRLLLEEFRQWELAWGNMPRLWVILLVLLPLAVGIPLVLYRREPRAIRRPVKVFLAGLRAFLISVLLLMLFEPILSLSREISRVSFLAMLVDESMSMTLKDKYADKTQIESLVRLSGIGLSEGEEPLSDAEEKVREASRMDLVNGVLRNQKVKLLETLGERFKVRFYGFSSGLNAEAKPGEMLAHGRETAIGGSLDAVARDLRGQQVAAVVIVSDGRSNSGVDPAATAQRWVERGLTVPVYTIGAGDPADPRDIELSKLEAPDVVVAKDEVLFRFQVKSTGYEKETATASVKLQGAQVASKSVTLEGTGREQRVEIAFKVQRPGEYDCIVEIPARAEEILADNNQLFWHLRVIDEKVHVLFLDGYPRWEYRALKNYLVRDPTMQVQCLLLSADLDFPQETSPGAPPLTEFPSDRKKLFSYDVVILGDVDPTQLVSSTISYEQALENLVDFVDDMGGGLVVIAGVRYNPRNYRDTPLAKILPVSLEEVRWTEEPAGQEVQGEFRVQLTALGRESPIMILDPSASPAENVEIWEDRDGRGDGLPTLRWFAPTRAPKPAAQVLAMHPAAKNRYGNQTLFALQRYGRGQVFFSAVDETWRWRYLRRDLYFGRFWGQVIRMMRSGKLLGSRRFRLDVDKKEYSIGDRVSFEVRILDADFQPIREASYPLTLKSEGQPPLEIQLAPVPNPTDETRKRGFYQGSWKATQPGTYEATIGPTELGSEEEAAKVRFGVGWPMREFDDPTPDHRTLRAISEVSGGEFLPLYQIGQLPERLRESSVIVEEERKEEDLWNAPGFILLFIAVLTLEWILRKLFQML